MKSACLYLRFSNQDEADRFLSLSLDKGFSGSTRSKVVTLSTENQGIDCGVGELLEWYEKCGMLAINPSLMVCSSSTFGLKIHHINKLSSLGFSVSFHHENT